MRRMEAKAGNTRIHAVTAAVGSQSFVLAASSGIDPMEQCAKPRVLVTSGPTRAYLDRVRYIANTSSGALGAQIVEAFAERGLQTVHIVGEGAISPGSKYLDHVETRAISTVDDLIAAVRHAAGAYTIGAVVHAMAVLDYMPERTLAQKKKSGDEEWTVRLVRTPKVIGMLRDLFPDAFLTGFKLEAGVSEQDLIQSACQLIETNRLDLAVANDLDRVTGDMHEALLIEPGGSVIARPSTKREIAETLAGMLVGRMG
jgi:phosphopantothenate---cysteine ligase (CTP)